MLVSYSILGPINVLKVNKNIVGHERALKIIIKLEICDVYGLQNPASNCVCLKKILNHPLKKEFE